MGLRSGPNADSDLSPLEVAVTEKLIAGDHPILAALREQLKLVTDVVWEFTGVGFFTNIRLPATCAAVDAWNLHLGDVEAASPALRHGAGFVLHVRGGLIVQLEGFTYDEPWPDDLGAVTLSYHSDDRSRTLQDLDDAIAQSMDETPSYRIRSRIVHEIDRFRSGGTSPIELLNNIWAIVDGTDLLPGARSATTSSRST
jgi:hypothetical protein